MLLFRLLIEDSLTPFRVCTLFASVILTGGHTYSLCTLCCHFGKNTPKIAFGEGLTVSCNAPRCVALSDEPGRHILHALVVASLLTPCVCLWQNQEMAVIAMAALHGFSNSFSLSCLFRVINRNSTIICPFLCPLL